jgi:hypothetical protein
METKNHPFVLLANKILRAEIAEEWLCPNCKVPVFIKFEKYVKRGEDRTGLRVTCAHCQCQFNSDGDSPIPKWYDDYKQPPQESGASAI